MRLGLLEPSLTTLLITLLIRGAASDALPQVQVPFSSPSSSTRLAAAPTATIYPPSTGGRAIRVVGTSDAKLGYDAYLGVPFARPPVGPSRWRPPNPPAYDQPDDTVIAQQWSPACAHPVFPSEDFSKLFDMVGKYGMAEDCLYLNVFTPSGGPPAPPAKSAPLPVMVWVYGGGFLAGTASTYDPGVLLTHARSLGRPMVFVSVAYRAGVLGWPVGKEFQDEGAENLGLRDVMLSLEWVQENIQAFGGDPKKVTVVGNSAGSDIVSLLYLQPSGGGLFRSAIMMSGAQSTVLAGPPAKNPNPSGVWSHFLELTGCRPPGGSGGVDGEKAFECLRRVPADTILSAQDSITLSYGPNSLASPSLDRDLIPEWPRHSLQDGKFHHIPFISGSTMDEGTMFILGNITNDDAFRGYVARFFPDRKIIARIEQLYPDDPSLGSPYGTGNQTFGFPHQNKRAAAFQGDVIFQAPRRLFLLAAQARGMHSQTWNYLSSQHPSSQIAAPPFAGAFHTLDVFHLFGWVGNVTDKDDPLGELTRHYMRRWTNFVYHTDPNGSGGAGAHNDMKPFWPAYGNKHRTTLRFGLEGSCVIRDDYREEQIAYFFDKQALAW